jgi:hypothetical protein
MNSVQQYEFDSKQDVIIERLSRSMRWIGLPLVIAGFFFALDGSRLLIESLHQPSSALGAVSAILGAMLCLALANWTRSAARSFHRIVTTKGQGIDHLMDGLDNLRKMYALLSVLVKIYVVVLFVALVLLITAGAVALWS